MIGACEDMADFTFAPLTPSAFLLRSAAVFPERTAIVDGDRSFSYREFADRSFALTGMLERLGIGRGDRVAALCLNSHVMLELHNGVPLRGAVLVPLNVRLSVNELAYVVEHSGASLLVATVELSEIAREVAAATGVRCVIAGGPADEYEQLLDGSAAAIDAEVGETDLIAINYTSGTTGTPKGVMYHHRGAFLQAMAMAYHTALTSTSRYLWTLPMFHCNGWCFTWAVTAAGGTHVCLRTIDPEQIWRLLRDEGITHFSAAPTVLSMIANSPLADGAPLAHRIRADTGGAPPSPTLLARLATLQIDVTHLYGLTETYGPLAINEWQSKFNEEDSPTRAVLRARQGVANVIGSPLRVVDANERDVAADGQTLGEIVARGNNVMLGYYLDDQGTQDVTTSDGWLRTGDLAVMHPDGYVEIRDRRKDIIISGGENIASIEVEQAIDSHPAVLECAVVGMPDERWGEVGLAYVTLRDGQTVSEAEILAHVRTEIAAFKVPRRVIFSALPKTATGKIQKNVLRARALG